MLENTWYSVISPESCSSILWKSWEYKEQAAEEINWRYHEPEPLGGAHW
jgi:acetyl-CoA carboxylase carboxyl transferase subunit alpha